MPGAYLTNPNKPAGLNPVYYLNGAKYDGKGQMYCVLAADTNPYYVGDIVTLEAGGDGKGIPAITLATAGTAAILGAIVAIGSMPVTGPIGGPYINPNNLAQNYRPSGSQPTNYYALVSDDPMIVYEIQEGGTGTNLTTAAINQNANFVYAAPATGTYVSGTQLNNATVTTTNTLPFQILRLAQRADNAFSTSPATGGAAQKWWVRINNHWWKAGITAP